MEVKSRQSEHEPRKALLKHDGITSKACQDDSAIQSQLCVAVSLADLGWIFKKETQSQRWQRENVAQFMRLESQYESLTLKQQR